MPSVSHPSWSYLAYPGHLNLKILHFRKKLYKVDLVQTKIICVEWIHLDVYVGVIMQFVLSLRYTASLHFVFCF